MTNFRSLLLNLGVRNLSLLLEKQKLLTLQYVRVTFEASIYFITHGVSFFLDKSKFGMWAGIISSRLPKKMVYSGEWRTQNNKKQ